MSIEKFKCHVDGRNNVSANEQSIILTANFLLRNIIHQQIQEFDTKIHEVNAFMHWLRKPVSIYSKMNENFISRPCF